MSNPASMPPEERGSGGNYYILVFAIPVVVVLGLIAMGIFSSNFRRAPSSGMGGLAPGAAMPEITAAGWVNGDAPTAEELRGKVVVVDAWATWCGPCRHEAPHLVELYRKYKDRGVVFIGLTSDDESSMAQIHSFLEQFNIEWRNGYGVDSTLRQLRAEVIPLVWVFGPDGRVVWNVDSSGSPEDGIEQALSMLPKSSG